MNGGGFWHTHWKAGGGETGDLCVYAEWPFARSLRPVCGGVEEVGVSMDI